MYLRSVIFILLVALAWITAVAVGETSAIETSNATLSGKIRIQGVNQEQLSPKNTFVSLKLLEQETAKHTVCKTHLLQMQNKQYIPDHMIINVGDTIEVENLDSVRHNVFSLSKPNDFDLGTFGPERKSTATFRKPGIVKVYCNIHSSMAAYILVSDTQWNTVLSDSGEFSFPALPPGNYDITAWNIRGEKREHVVLKSNDMTALDLVIQTHQNFADEHLNKWGKPYTAASNETQGLNYDESF